MWPFKKSLPVRPPGLPEPPDDSAWRMRRNDLSGFKMGLESRIDIENRRQERIDRTRDFGRKILCHVYEEDK